MKAVPAISRIAVAVITLNVVSARRGCATITLGVYKRLLELNKEASSVHFRIRFWAKPSWCHPLSPRGCELDDQNRQPRIFTSLLNPPAPTTELAF